MLRHFIVVVFVVAVLFFVMCVRPTPKNYAIGTRTPSTEMKIADDGDYRTLAEGKKNTF